MELELESILLPGIEEKRPLVIAGPCSAETEEQVMDTAKQLAAKGMKIFRAGIWKPRTKPGGFEVPVIAVDIHESTCHATTSPIAGQTLGLWCF